MGANWERASGQPLDAGRAWNWWLRVYHERVNVVIDVERVVVWPELTCNGAPCVHGAPLPAEPPAPQRAPGRGTGPRVEHRRAAKGVARLPHVLLGWVGADGFPVAIPVAVRGSVTDGIVLDAPAGLVPAGGRRAGLTAHSFSRYVIGQQQSRFTGWLESTGGHVIYAPHTKAWYRFPRSRFAFNLAAGYGTRRGLSTGTARRHPDRCSLMAAGRIVLFGATGYTGRLTAEAMVARGDRPVLAGRNPEPLAELARELGGLETATADVDRPHTVRALLERGDVLVTTVGPFTRWGDAAVDAAVDAGAAYLDAAAEPGFLRRIFEHHSPQARRAGVPLLTAFGWESVPGNMAGELALRQAGETATRIDLGAFMSGDTRGWTSGGTRASLAGALLEPGFVWRDGIRTERGAARVRSFDLNGRRRPALSAAFSEHFTLPRRYPQLREVNTYIGWFGRASRALQLLSAVGAGVRRIPGFDAAVAAVGRRLPQGSTGGPDAQTRAKTVWRIVAVAHDGEGHELSVVHLAAGNGYEFTGRILAWGASRAATGLDCAGAVGPAEAFGLAALERGCAEAGLHR